jgi:CDP-diacylglycerol--glycerol-3-phosphate 3-phosphatidyltransferase
MYIIKKINFILKKSNLIFIPNILSISRIFYSLIILFFLNIIKQLVIQKYKIFIIIFLLFLIGCLTDFFDGFLSRKIKKNYRKNFILNGKILDIVSDKIFVISIYLILIFERILKSKQELLIIILLIIRDIIIMGMRISFSLKRNGYIISTNFLGKIKTAIQMTNIGIYLLHYLFFECYFIDQTKIIVYLFFKLEITTLMLVLFFSIISLLKNLNNFLLQEFKLKI